MHPSPEIEKTSSDRQNGNKTAKRALGPRSSKYWARRVFLGKTTRNGKTYFTSNYYVKIQHAGQRELFGLNTADKEEAMKLAEEIYYLIRSGPDGWQRAVDKYRKKMVVRSDDPTIGDYLKAVKELSGMSPETFAGYARKLRRVAAAIHTSEHLRQANKYDAKKNGRTKWVEEVEKIPLRVLTDVAVRRWQVAYVAAREGDPVKVKMAKHTVDSNLRSCKSLFAPKVVKWAKHLRLPDPLPFRNIGLMTKGLSSFRYRSSIDPVALLADAQTDLRKDKPECYKIFLLALGGGLRRMEMDRLLWSSVLVDRSIIRIEEHKFLSAKSGYSLGDLAVEKELITELLALRQLDDVFVIRSDNAPRNTTSYRYYRAEKDFAYLCAWLRGKGVKAKSPIHTLRKEFGRLLTEGYGIYAASTALRHSSVQVTAAFYAEDTRRIVPSLLGRKVTAGNLPTSQLTPAGGIAAA